MGRIDDGAFAARPLIDYSANAQRYFALHETLDVSAACTRPTQHKQWEVNQP